MQTQNKAQSIFQRVKLFSEVSKHLEKYVKKTILIFGVGDSSANKQNIFAVGNWIVGRPVTTDEKLDGDGYCFEKSNDKSDALIDLKAQGAAINLQILIINKPQGRIVCFPHFTAQQINQSFEFQILRQFVLKQILQKTQQLAIYITFKLDKIIANKLTDLQKRLNSLSSDLVYNSQKTKLNFLIYGVLKMSQSGRNQFKNKLQTNIQNFIYVYGADQGNNFIVQQKPQELSNYFISGFLKVNQHYLSFKFLYNLQEQSKSKESKSKESKDTNQEYQSISMKINKCFQAYQEIIMNSATPFNFLIKKSFELYKPIKSSTQINQPEKKLQLHTKLQQRDFKSIETYYNISTTNQNKLKLRDFHSQLEQNFKDKLNQIIQPTINQIPAQLSIFYFLNKMYCICEWYSSKISNNSKQSKIQVDQMKLLFEYLCSITTLVNNNEGFPDSMRATNIPSYYSFILNILKQIKIFQQISQLMYSVNFNMKTYLKFISPEPKKIIQSMLNFQMKQNQSRDYYNVIIQVLYDCGKMFKGKSPNNALKKKYDQMILKAQLWKANKIIDSQLNNLQSIIEAIKIYSKVYENKNTQSQINQNNQIFNFDGILLKVGYLLRIVGNPSTAIIIFKNQKRFLQLEDCIKEYAITLKTPQKCNLYFSQASYYFSVGQFQLARKYYQMVFEESIDQAQRKNAKLQILQLSDETKRQARMKTQLISLQKLLQPQETIRKYYVSTLPINFKQEIQQLTPKVWNNQQKFLLKRGKLCSPTQLLNL